ncbi:MAG: hypothetical protein V8S34_02280 [Lawsonibacter sp.]
MSQGRLKVHLPEDAQLVFRGRGGHLRRGTLDLAAGQVEGAFTDPSSGMTRYRREAGQPGGSVHHQYFDIAD